MNEKHNPKISTNKENLQAYNIKKTDKQNTDMKDEKGCLMGCLFGTLAVIISLFVIVTVDGLAGFLTGAILLLIVSTVLFGPGVLAVVAVLSILFLELYLFAYFQNFILMILGILALIWIIKVWKQS